jgi:hypothetical protein
VKNMSKLPQTNNLLEEISGKLDKVLKLLAIDAVKGFEKEQQKIELLDSIGFKPSEIAKMLNKSPENVSVVLGSMRKKKDQKTPTKPESKVVLEGGT